MQRGMRLGTTLFPHRTTEDGNRKWKEREKLRTERLWINRKRAHRKGVSTEGTVGTARAITQGNLLGSWLESR